MAATVCEDFVKQRLKAPGTAQFRDPVDIGRVSTKTFRVTGQVDAENSFGALLRNTYVCQIRLFGYDSLSTASWRLEDLTME